MVGSGSGSRQCKLQVMVVLVVIVMSVASTLGSTTVMLDSTTADSLQQLQLHIYLASVLLATLLSATMRSSV
jgi:hypothetical protein